MKYKGFTIDDKAIENLVDKLGISITEAAEIYLTDNELLTNETVEELTEKARKNCITSTIHTAKKAQARKPRSKKENLLKKEILSVILKGLM